MNSPKNDDRKTWNGIPRSKIKWHPTIDKNKCSQCLSCVNFCKQGVYEIENGKPVVKNPLNCVVGCTGCDGICPTGAISHPPKEYLEKLAGKTDPVVSCCSNRGCCPSQKK